MTPRELLDTADVPGGEPLRLFRRGDDHMIVLERNELMNSRMSGSEEALAVMTLERLGKREARLLIGGYGMGFTLRAALAVLGNNAKVTVAELVPKIVDWARGPMAALTNGCLDDPRVNLVFNDVGRVIADGRGAFDAILLDVDNGPDGLTRPGGILAVWSAAPDPAFARRMRDSDFVVEEVAVRARQNGKGPRHVIWFGKRR
jgi:spermidine synthase